MSLTAGILHLLAADIDRDGILDLVTDLSFTLPFPGQNVVLPLLGAGDGTFVTGRGVQQDLPVRSLTLAPSAEGDVTIAVTQSRSGCSGPDVGIVLLRAIDGELRSPVGPVAGTAAHAGPLRRRHRRRPPRLVAATTTAVSCAARVSWTESSARRSSSARTAPTSRSRTSTMMAGSTRSRAARAACTSS
jgi:hypothetical protein